MLALRCDSQRCESQPKRSVLVPSLAAVCEKSKVSGGRAGWLAGLGLKGFVPRPLCSALLLCLIRTRKNTNPTIATLAACLALAPVDVPHASNSAGQRRTDTNSNDHSPSLPRIWPTTSPDSRRSTRKRQLHTFLAQRQPFSFIFSAGWKRRVGVHAAAVKPHPTFLPVSIKGFCGTPRPCSTIELTTFFPSPYTIHNP